MVMFRLESLAAAPCVPEEPPAASFERRVAFARYLSRLDPSLEVELRYRGVPQSEMQGRTIETSINLRHVDGAVRDDASAVGFLASLRAHFPEVEIGNVSAAPARERQRGNVWRFGHALLRVPLGGGLPEPAPVGFGPQAARSESPEEAVELVIPWVPSASDWRRVAEMLYWSDSPLSLCVTVRAFAFSGSAAEAELTETIRRLDAVPQLSSLISRDDSALIRSRLVERRNSLLASCHLLDVTLQGAEISRETASLLATELSGQITDMRSPWDACAGAVAFCREPMARESEGAEPGLRDLFAAAEVAGVLRFPSPPPSHLEGFPVRRFRTNVAAEGASSNGAGSLYLGVNVHRGVEKKVHLSLEERRRHVWICGQTGTGKSTLLERMILQDIEAGHGLAVLDPHGDLVENVLARMPPERAGDVIVFDFAEEEKPIAFNPLVWSTLAERDFIIEEIIASITGRMPVEFAGPLFETYSRNFLKLLMGDGPRPEFQATFTDFPLLFQDGDLRRALLESMSDATVADFVREAESNTADYKLTTMAGWITSKFSRFTGSGTVMRTVGQGKNDLDFRAVMDEGRILLVNLAKGRVGALSAELLCSLFIMKFRATAMSRATIPIEERRDFTLYVDEFQNVASPAYSEILSEARKYRLGLVLANQFISQLPQGVTQAILGN
ncbi:MAG TPA: type IV secretory system conjugative DNA transfer family protein, partial [Thermoanaerobaculia bacterium]